MSSPRSVSPEREAFPRTIFLRERVFPGLAAGLWVGFLALDLLRLGDSTPLKLAGILLCLLFAWLGAADRDGLLVALALSFTVGADWFLLVRGDHFPLGIALFCVVQVLYTLRLAVLRGYISPLGLTVRALAGGAALAVWLGRGWLPPLPTGMDLGTTLLALFYFTGLCCNAIEALLLSRRAPSRELCSFALGLGLFLCCDVCVGLWNLSPVGLSASAEAVFASLHTFSRVGMWLFYLPSQVLLVLSTPASPIYPLKGDHRL